MVQILCGVSQLEVGNVTANVTVFGISSGAPVQIATIVYPPAIALNAAMQAQHVAYVTFAASNITEYAPT